jgi:DNA-binding GntR family transcriptional regulator
MAPGSRPPTRRLKPAARTRLTDHALEALRSSILNGDFAMGERLVETQLASELEMSRAPIREALQRLRQEGLVEERPHQGTFVCSLGASDVADLYNTRLGLEVVAIRLFVRGKNPTAPLWAEITAMERAAAKGARSQVVRHEMDFHRHIVGGADNHYLARVFHELEGQALLAMALDDAAIDLEEIAAEHVPVVEAIETGNEAEAARAYHAHIVSTVDDVLERLGGATGIVLAPID